jgi:hypothetical protein
MEHLARITSGILLAFMLSGCGMTYFQDRSENPVVFDPIGSSGFLGAPRSFAAISAQAGRSTILVNIDKESPLFGTFCAAPPPDAAENLATYFALRAKAAVTDQTSLLEGSGSLAFEDSFARSLAPLVRRSQGLELFKYGMFYYCQDYMNGKITGRELEDLRSKLLIAATTAISQEVTNDKWFGFPPAYKAPQLQSNIFNCVPDTETEGRFVCEVEDEKKSTSNNESDASTEFQTPPQESPATQ